MTKISLDPGQVNSLGELTNHLETIIRNRKHIKNLPSLVQESLPDILSDMRTNHKSATAIILQGPNDLRIMSERVEHFSLPRIYIRKF